MLIIYEAGYLRRVVKGGLGGFFYAVSSGMLGNASELSMFGMSINYTCEKQIVMKNVV